MRISLLDVFATDDNKVFTMNNLKQSEAFGIKFEPVGGSEGTNLEQLYSRSTVSSF